MPSRQHHYLTRVTWTGNRGSGTANYVTYDRTHEVSAPEKPAIPCSSDPAFRGDAARWNPEELFVSSLSACHMLWYLHLCADAGLVVVAYTDNAEGVMVGDVEGVSRFTGVALRPGVTLAAGSDLAIAKQLHHTAHKKCFLANSVNFEVSCEPTLRWEEAAPA